MQLELNLNMFDNTKKTIEKNLIRTNLKYLFHNEFKDQIRKILNDYTNKTIGEKRCSEISKRIGKIVAKKANRLCIYRVPKDKYYGTFFDNTGKEYDYNELPKTRIMIRTGKNQDYYGNERIFIEIDYGGTITTIYFDLKNGKYEYQEAWDKLIYNNLEDIPELAVKIKDLYNSSITKIQELKQEIHKQEQNINNEYMRNLTNRSLYIYGDYRDILMED